MVHILKKFAPKYFEVQSRRLVAMHLVAMLVVFTGIWVASTFNSINWVLIGLAIALLNFMKVVSLIVKFGVADYKQTPGRHVCWDIIFLITCVLIVFFSYLYASNVLAEAKPNAQSVALIGLVSSLIFALIDGLDKRWT